MKLVDNSVDRLLADKRKNVDMMTRVIMDDSERTLD